MSEINIKKCLTEVKKASYELQALDEPMIAKVLSDFSTAILENSELILEANKKDLSKMDPKDPLYDRLLLNEPRLQAIAGDIKKVITLNSPVGEVIEERTLDNGLNLSRVRVPIGVIAVIYEARPNVTMDVFSLCFRTKNACVLRGGTDAHETNLITVSLIHKVLEENGINKDIVFLMPPERSYMPELLKAHESVDVCIPRGSQGLIDFVRENSSIPVIETGRGVVHIYIDKSADLNIGADIIKNAKTRRPSVCNSLDTLIVHEDRLEQLQALTGALANDNVHILCDQKCKGILESFYPQNMIGEISADSLNEEFMSLKMNLISVSDHEQAISHIRAHGSGHTESIITQDQNIAEQFLSNVDASVVMVNASTSFSDGGEFGLGAEIGISTQKLHARGPMGLEPLTSYKWIMRGSGQIRSA